ncbi:MAG: hypothetical protein IH945_11620 [Armatimonadetes bacterium]|nr:hypothetical protein [Armatimonadota bacterium]
MNQSKARDFYSAYFEGTLDSGLTQAFERALRTEAEIKAEYEQFVRVMDDLKACRSPVEPPADLHLKIRERVDAHILSTDRKDRTGILFFAWKPLAYGAVAAMAIIGVVASFTNRSAGPGGPAEAAFASIQESAPAIVFEDGETRLNYSAGSQNVVSVYRHSDGTLVFEEVLQSQTIESPLFNGSDDATLVSVHFASRYGTLFVAVPGSTIQTDGERTGTVLDLMTSLAGKYKVPVVLASDLTAVGMSWQFDGTDAALACQDELKAIGLRVETRENGLVWISAS